MFCNIEKNPQWKRNWNVYYWRILDIDWINSLHAYIQSSSVRLSQTLSFFDLFFGVYQLFYYIIWYFITPYLIHNRSISSIKLTSFYNNIPSECTKHSFKHINFSHTRKFRIIRKKKESKSPVHHKVIQSQNL